MIEDFENFIQTDESFLVVLDSRNATVDNTTNGDNSNLTFNLQTPIKQPINTINFKASVLNFTCPNSQYVINDTNNYLGISFDTSGTPYSNATYGAQYLSFYVKIPNGNYNAYTFSKQLIIELANLSRLFGPEGSGLFGLGVFGVSYNETTSKFTIINDTYYFFISQNIIFNQFYNVNFNEKIFYTIGDVMGFNNTKTYKSAPFFEGTLLPPFGIELPYPVNFGGLQNINVHIENLKTYNLPYQAKNLVLTTNNKQEYQNFSKGNIACSVPVNCKPMEVIFYQKTSDFAFTIKDEQIDVITIALRDDLGNLLKLNGQNWNMTLEFILTKHTERKTRNFYSILSNPYPRFE
jgi:hypothetical protein